MTQETDHHRHGKAPSRREQTGPRSPHILYEGHVQRATYHPRHRQPVNHHSASGAAQWRTREMTRHQRLRFGRLEVEWFHPDLSNDVSCRRQLLFSNRYQGSCRKEPEAGSDPNHVKLRACSWPLHKQQEHQAQNRVQSLEH